MLPFVAAPWWLTIAFVTVAFVTIACAGHVAVKRTFRKADFIVHNEVAGFIIAVVGVLYAVLLGFLTIVVWEQYSQAEDRAAQEVDAATDVWRFAPYLEPADGKALTLDVGRYASAVLFDEWPKMRHGASSDAAQTYLVRLFDDAAGMHVASDRDSNLQYQILERVRTMADLRRSRVNYTHSGVPYVIWVALLLGAAIVIGFEYLFGLPNFKVQLLMTGMTAAIIGLSFSIVILLDYPFRGDVSISPERWAALHEQIGEGH